MRPVRKVFDALENHRPGTDQKIPSGKCRCAAVTLEIVTLTPAGGALFSA